MNIYTGKFISQGGRTMEDITIYGMALVPVIMGLVELLKRVGIPKKYVPVFAILLGILCGLYYLAPDDPGKPFLGIVMGLSSIGLYSGTKILIKDCAITLNIITQRNPPFKRRIFRLIW